MSSALQALSLATPLLGWLGLISLITFVLSILFIPWIVGRLPVTFFISLTATGERAQATLPSALFYSLLRNIFGLILLFAGLLMLFLPGQGLLTILLALILISFPGKQRILAALIARSKVQRSMDWLRRQRGKAPFIWPG